MFGLLRVILPHCAIRASPYAYLIFKSYFYFQELFIAGNSQSDFDAVVVDVENYDAGTFVEEGIRC